MDHAAHRSPLIWLHALILGALGDRRRLILAAIVGEVCALSALQHLWNFWGWPSGTQLWTSLLIGPALSIPVSAGLTPIWTDIRSIARARWMQFLMPAVLVAGAITWQLFSYPEINHELTVRPLGRAGAVRITEIRLAYGRVIPLSDLANLEGWSLEAGALTARTPGAKPIKLSFRGPIGELIRISFVTAADGGTASVNLDGRRLDLNLQGPEDNETRARFITQYRWGPLNVLMIPLIATIDILAGLFLLGAIWVAHEIGQRPHQGRSHLQDDAKRPHRAGLLLVCSLALALHIFSFLAVPLRVTKDGPSYVQGAAHWVAFHNFDGASSYRGPATTFLFAPAMEIFGRNPWGVKLVLHALAFACVPLAYRIGWQLQRRRWVAVAAGLLTALSPDLYAYSNFTLSEVPHIFALLAYCTLLLTALGSLSPRLMLISLVAGSLTVLVRADNIVAAGLGAAALALTVMFSKTAANDPAREFSPWWKRLRGLVMALLLAALPLVGWSAHNLRVHGFFGISNYGGEVLYDGWIYFAESLGTHLLDRESPAVLELDAVIPILDRDDAEPPTGWAVYHALLQHGYESQRAFSLLGQATLDSIRSHLQAALRVLVLKLRQAPRPEPIMPAPITSTEKVDRYADSTAEYFDQEAGLSGALGTLQLGVYRLVGRIYSPVYGAWFAFCILTLWLSSYRRPPLAWLTIAAISLAVLLLPTVIGLPNWRYLIPGTLLLSPMALATADTMGSFGSYYLGRLRSIMPNPTELPPHPKIGPR